MKPPIMCNAPQIERVGAIDVETFRENYVIPQKPVIFGSGFTEWDALRNWTPSYLHDQFPDLDVVDENTQETTRLDTFVRQVENGESLWGRVYLIDQYPNMLQNVSPLPPYLADSWIHGRYLPPISGLKRRIQHASRPDLLIGGCDSYFPMYHHEHSYCHCMLYQIHGKKRVVLFEPDAKDALYPHSKYPTKSALSPVEVPDPKTYPLFEKAKFLTGTLLPGDTLFSPSAWWLGLQNPTISLTLRRHYVEGSNWEPFCREFLRAPAAHSKSYPKSMKAALTAVILKVLGVAYAATLRR